MTPVTSLDTVKTKLATTLKAGSLASLIQAKKAERLTFLLIDCSSSMNGGTGEYGGPSRMRGLANVVQTLHSDGLRPPMVGFGLNHSDPIAFVTDVPGQGIGGTPLAQAITFAHQHNAGHLIVVSDGEPDDANAALWAADAFGGPIDIFFVGTPGGSGERFLQQIARATKGQCQSVSLAQPAQLTAGIRGLLAA